MKIINKILLWKPIQQCAIYIVRLSLPDELEICKHFSVKKDYVPDGAPYEPETAIKNKYRREGAVWYNNLIRDRGNEA